MSTGASLRPSRADDAAALARIYAHAVLHGVGTFEEAPPPAAELAQRRLAVIGHGLPHLVAEDGRGVLGFACAAPFRTRAGYRYTAETSVYVDPGAQGEGVGAALLSQVVSACEALGVRRLIAVIGGAQNAGSIALHARAGFVHAGVLPAAGFKFGGWIDVVMMQRALGDGCAGAPPTPGLTLGR